VRGSKHILPGGIFSDGKVAEAKEAHMIDRRTGSPGLISLLVARWKVSPLGMIPSTLSLICLPLLLAAAAVTQVMFEESSKIPGIATLSLWFSVVIFDFGRGMWILANPYASARWLHAVRATVGVDIADHALAHLVTCYGEDPEYVIKRTDMSIAVQVAKRQQQSRQASDVRLVDYQHS
jgi:hypothetical protein